MGGPAVSMELPVEFDDALRCYGRATIMQLTRVAKLPHFSSLSREKLSWQGSGYRPSEKEVEKLRELADVSTRPVSSRKLLKQGLRALAERHDPSLKAYYTLYRYYFPDRWYYEIISIFGRVGYAIVLILPAAWQGLTGLILSSLLLLSCLLMPFRRDSDTHMAAACYTAMVGLFGVQCASRRVGAVKNDPMLRSGFGLACMSIPCVAIVYYLLKAYVLPSRRRIRLAEAADHVFEEEFVRVRLGSGNRRRQQREIELAEVTCLHMGAEGKDHTQDTFNNNSWFSRRTIEESQPRDWC